MLRKILSFSGCLALLVLLSACAPVEPDPVLALQTNVGIDALMGNTCNTGYTRVAPHVCQQQCTACQAYVQYTQDNACHAIDLHAAWNFPNTNTTGALAHLQMFGFSLAGVTVGFYASNTCTGSAYFSITGISGFQPVYMFPIQTLSGNLYYKTSGGTGGLYGFSLPVDYYD